ncbi:alpha-(1,3)-fucosyltransferase fut-3-like [Dermacentor andersoni]|uniref:alpha-(1,3)-fucosyltransferase fut-3-like n=1 Tax=Dermacentor andersoni TaxID=34620 RepID=UPI0024160DD6|nr:alpha-(1,3)-fucosyltransferase fut-3-like [Dermacentor andersoni]
MAAHREGHVEEIALVPLNRRVHLIPNGTIPSVPLHVPQHNETVPRCNIIAVCCCYAIAIAISCAAMLYQFGVFSDLGYWTTPTLRGRRNGQGMPLVVLWSVPRGEGVVETANELAVVGYEPVISACYNGGSQRPRNCVFTENHQRTQESNAVVFHSAFFSVYDVPEKRAADQLWVLWAPSRLLPARSNSLRGLTVETLPSVAKMFNWTFSHWDEADVHVPHKQWRCGGLVNDSRNLTEWEQNSFQEATNRKDAAWIVDECQMQRIRKQVGQPPAAAVASPIRLSLITACGSAYCKSRTECVRYVAENFHFIFVSKSPGCFASADEVIYDAFQYDLVPVVFGLPKDAVGLPKRSVVNAASLNKPGELAKHLRSLLDEPSKYESYFAWKRECVVTSPLSDLCALCDALYEEPVRAAAYSQALEWWTNITACSDLALHFFNGIVETPM